MDSEEFGRARDLAAWLLLAGAAVFVVMGAWELLGLPRAPFSEPTFTLRSNVATASLVAIDVTALPVAAVLLVTLVGRAGGAARQITRVAVILQAIALGLGVIAWTASLGISGPGTQWLYLSGASHAAVAAAGLILTSAVLRSRARR
jgi:hypothetical protein